MTATPGPVHRDRPRPGPPRSAGDSGSCLWQRRSDPTCDERSLSRVLTGNARKSAAGAGSA